MIAKSISIKVAGCKFGGCGLEAANLDRRRVPQQAGGHIAFAVDVNCWLKAQCTHSACFWGTVVGSVPKIAAVSRK
jgi:hypothetical protein